jgi:hypothetical protein
MTPRDDRPEGGADPKAREAGSLLELALYSYFKHCGHADPMDLARAVVAFIDEHADLDVDEIRALGPQLARLVREHGSATAREHRQQLH